MCQIIIYIVQIIHLFYYALFLKASVVRNKFCSHSYLAHPVLHNRNTLLSYSVVIHLHVSFVTVCVSYLVEMIIIYTPVYNNVTSASVCVIVRRCTAINNSTPRFGGFATSNSTSKGVMVISGICRGADVAINFLPTFSFQFIHSVVMIYNWGHNWVHQATPSLSKGALEEDGNTHTHANQPAPLDNDRQWCLRAEAFIQAWIEAGRNDHNHDTNTAINHKALQPQFDHRLQSGWTSVDKCWPLKPIPRTNFRTGSHLAIAWQWHPKSTAVRNQLRSST